MPNIKAILLVYTWYLNSGTSESFLYRNTNCFTSLSRHSQCVAFTVAKCQCRTPPSSTGGREKYRYDDCFWLVKKCVYRRWQSVAFTVYSPSLGTQLTAVADGGSDSDMFVDVEPMVGTIDAEEDKHEDEDEYEYMDKVNSSFENIFPSFEMDQISDSSQSGSVVLESGQFPSDEELALLPKGQKGGFKVVRQYTVPDGGFNPASVPVSGENDVLREEKEEDSIMSKNNTIDSIQVALTLLDPVNYQSLSQARKACRKGSILIHRGPIPIPPAPSMQDDQNNDYINAFCSKLCKRARVGDAIYPGDVIAVQKMMGTFRKKRSYPQITYSRPRFSLPVLYEDDHMAIVDKPANIGMYGQRRGRSGNISRRTVRDILPYCLTPPTKGTPGGVLKRPMAVHRLDTPTSGLVVVAKTKVAMDCLYRQFEERRVVKTYTAIVNGIPLNSEPLVVPIPKVADGSGCNDNGSRGNGISNVSSPVVGTESEINTGSSSSSEQWNVINYPLGGKHAITTWRTLRSAESLHAKDGTLTLVEVQPRTGRYHQIRRHMAWICRRPLVGDALYAGALQATRFRKNGLYLCSNGITLDHPYYNSPQGKKDWEEMVSSSMLRNSGKMVNFVNEMGTVKVTVCKDLPKRFEKLLYGEDLWAKRMKANNQNALS